MSVNAADLPQYIDKKVVLHTINDDQTVTEREGTVVAASAQGLAFKEKGKSSPDLYSIDQLEEIDHLKEGPKKIRQKKLKPIEDGQIRQHLVDRHGMPVSRANDMTEDDAKKVHDQIDHKDLGHRHEASEKTSQEKAIESAESDAA